MLLLNGMPPSSSSDRWRKMFTSFQKPMSNSLWLLTLAEVARGALRIVAAGGAGLATDQVGS